MCSLKIIVENYLHDQRCEHVTVQSVLKRLKDEFPMNVNGMLDAEIKHGVMSKHALGAGSASKMYKLSREALPFYEMWLKNEDRTEDESSPPAMIYERVVASMIVFGLMADACNYLDVGRSWGLENIIGVADRTISMGYVDSLYWDEIFAYAFEA